MEVNILNRIGLFDLEKKLNLSCGDIFQLVNCDDINTVLSRLYILDYLNEITPDKRLYGLLSELYNYNIVDSYALSCRTNIEKNEIDLFYKLNEMRTEKKYILFSDTATLARFLHNEVFGVIREKYNLDNISIFDFCKKNQYTFTDINLPQYTNADIILENDIKRFQEKTKVSNYILSQLSKTDIYNIDFPTSAPIEEKYKMVSIFSTLCNAWCI